MDNQLEDKVDDLQKSGGLDSRWFSEDKKPEDKDRTKQVLLNSTIQFRLLKKILTVMFKEKKLKPVDFDKPSVDQMVYYNEGYRQALQDVYRILP